MAIIGLLETTGATSNSLLTTSKIKLSSNPTASNTGDDGAYGHEVYTASAGDIVTQVACRLHVTQGSATIVRVGIHELPTST